MAPRAINLKHAHYGSGHVFEKQAMNVTWVKRYILVNLGQFEDDPPPPPPPKQHAN